MLRLAVAGTIFDFIGILTVLLHEIVNACTYGSGMLIRFSIASVPQFPNSGEGFKYMPCQL
jgi:hypothetical protein